MLGLDVATAHESVVGRDTPHVPVAGQRVVPGLSHGSQVRVAARLGFRRIGPEPLGHGCEPARKGVGFDRGAAAVHLAAPHADLAAQQVLPAPGVLVAAQIVVGNDLPRSRRLEAGPVVKIPLRSGNRHHGRPVRRQRSHSGGHRLIHIIQRVCGQFGDVWRISPLERIAHHTPTKKTTTTKKLKKE